MSKRPKDKALPDDINELDRMLEETKKKNKRIQMITAANKEEINRVHLAKIKHKRRDPPIDKNGLDNESQAMNTDQGEDSSDVNVSDDSEASSDGSSQYATEKSDDNIAIQKEKGSKPSDLMNGRENITAKKTLKKDPVKIQKNNQTINKHIHESLSRKVEDMVEVFRKDFSMTRPYCNRVMVKVPKTELLQIQTRKQVVYLEQEFKLTKDTKFETLKDMCCDFWGLKRDSYSLYDAKFGHLMALNEDEYHPAHSVSNYFEVLKVRYPSLFLLKDERSRPEIKNVEQLASATISNASRRGASNPDAVIASAEDKTAQEAQQRRQNLNIFNRAFPGQKQYQLDKEKRTTRLDISLLPDTYFSTFLVNSLLIIAVIVFFFYSRNVSEEFFIRKNISNVFEKKVGQALDNTPPIALEPFSRISSADSFERFMQTTLPYGVFSDNDDAQLRFSLQNAPLDSLKIRTQHWDKTIPPLNPIISPKLGQTENLDAPIGPLKQLETDMVLPNGEILKYKTAAENGVETILLDDDFQDGIMGDGYQLEVPLNKNPQEGSDFIISLFENSNFFRESSIRICVVTLAFYIPSHDMIISILMEIRFDQAGSVRTRSFEVLPTQIYTAGSSTDEDVLHRANLVLAFSVIRILCSCYTALVICLKIRYRGVIGRGAVVSSSLRDCFQIFMAVYPVVTGYGVQGRLNLDDLDAQPKPDFHQLGRDSQFVQHLDGFFLLFMSFRIVHSFRIFAYMDWLINVLERTISRIATFYMAILPFFVVMIVMLYFVAGANVEETSTLVRSIFTIIRFALGIGNTSEYYPINQSFYYAWSLIFVFSLYYFLLPVSIALFLEAYEEITMELGHVTDYAHAQPKGKCTKWMIQCPPWKALHEKNTAMVEIQKKRDKGLVIDEEDED